jgi:hypothetical protein
MKIWNRPRGNGKTIRMLYASEYTGNNILVNTKQRAEQLEFEAHRLHLHIPHVICVNEFLDRNITKCSQDIIIDEAFDVLEAFVCGVRPSTTISDITITSYMKED